jgi:hypothetical protein
MVSRAQSAALEGDEEGFEAMMGRIRKTWQAKLEATWVG